MKIAHLTLEINYSNIKKKSNNINVQKDWLWRLQIYKNFPSEIESFTLNNNTLRHYLNAPRMVTVKPFFFFFPFFLLWLHPWHMEDPRLGVETELQLPAYTTATAMPGLSLVCGLHHSSWQCRILNPLSQARDRTHILVDTSRILNPLSHNRNSLFFFCRLKKKTYLERLKWLYA